MDIDLLDLFENLYNSDIYAANRLLLDFPDYLIEDLEKSGRYTNLFTTTLQNDLYREKIKILNLSKEKLEEILEIQRRTGITWQKIYNIASIITGDYDSYISELFTSIFNNDDVAAYQIAKTINMIYAQYYWYTAIQYSRISIRKAKQILLHIASTENIRFDMAVLTLICMGAGRASSNDLEYIKLFAKTLFNHIKEIDPTLGGLSEKHAIFLIYSDIKDGVLDLNFVNRDVIEFFLNNGCVFQREHEIPKIRAEFGEEYAENVRIRSDENSNVIAT
ncbi:MAG: hypothetical protein Solivirus2_5 [Solivirus sp.]|uniref:Uncharacterized protein n=1 Tax=Solivirus sp. TaxID=2487772 RepID=A0A3G5AH68_9VIRU|nr:MAG: hypothetical protein Solivirus2_5 [Solivirus sp.]